MAGKRKMIYILAVLLVVLLAANWVLGAWNQRQSQREEEAEEADKIYLLDVDDITAYSYSNGEEEMSFAQTDGQWYYEEDPEISLNQSTVQNTADNIAGMTAVRLLEEPDEMSDYGLDTPLYTIDYTDSDGTESAIYIGNGAGENYYATVGDTGRVFTVSSEFQSWLSFELADLVQYDTVPSIGSGNLKKVTVAENGEETIYEEEDDIAELAGGFGTITLTDCADYHAADEALPKYGLDQEHRITVTAEYEDSSSGEAETFVLYVGNLDDAGDNRYVMTQDSRMVYQVSASVVQNLMTVEE